MIRKILNCVLRRQDIGHRVIGQFAYGDVGARVFERRLRDGTVEYWIEARWITEGREGTSSGLLRRAEHGLHFDAMREAQSYLRQLPR